MEYRLLHAGILKRILPDGNLLYIGPRSADGVFDVVRLVSMGCCAISLRQQRPFFVRQCHWLIDLSILLTDLSGE